MNSKKSASTSNNSNSSKITERTGTDRSDSTAVDEGQQVSVKLMIAVKNGFNVSPVIKELEQFQISAQSDVTDVIRQTNEKNISRLETGAMILICAIFMPADDCRSGIDRKFCMAMDLDVVWMAVKGCQ